MTAPLLADPEERQKGDRRITILLILSGMVGALVLVGTPFVISAAHTATEVQKSTDLNGCRSAYAAEVTDRRTDLDIASSELRRLNTDTDNAQIAVTRDALFNDGANVSALLETLDAAGREELALADVVTVKEQALVRANRAYQSAVALSRSDPDKFLTQCNSEDQ